MENGIDDFFCVLFHFSERYSNDEIKLYLAKARCGYCTLKQTSVMGLLTLWW